MDTEPVTSQTGRQPGLRRQRQWAVAIAAGALAVGTVLLPRGDELLLILTRSYDVERAGALLPESDMPASPSTASLVTRSELFLLEGRVDRATADAESYVAAHPDDAAAWSHLAALYLDGQRRSDWVKALQQLYRLTPTSDRAREIALWLRRSGDVDAERLMLRDLVSSHAATGDEVVRFASLSAAAHDLVPARTALDALRLGDPRAFTYPVMELYASVLLETGGTDRLGPHLQTLPAASQDPRLVTELAFTIRNWGAVDAALALLRPVDGVTPHADWLEAYAYAARGTRHAERVALELDALDVGRPLPAGALREFVALALSRNDDEMVERVLVRHSSDRDPALAAAAITHVVARGRRDRAQQLIATLGDDGLVETPILALDLALERSDRDAAERWIQIVDSRPAVSPQDSAALAHAEIALGHDDRAFARLSGLAATTRAPAWALTDLTIVAGRLGRGAEALDVLAQAARRSPDARRAWALLAVNTDRLDLIDAWLAAGPSGPDEAPALRDLYYALSDRSLARQALEAARQLHRATRPSGGLVGSARARVDPELVAVADTVYDVALHAAQSEGLNVERELRATFTVRVQDASLTDRHREMLVEGLWRAGERASLHDHVLRFASVDPVRWLSALVESARALGQTDRAIALILRALGPADGLESARLPERLPFVYALQDLGASDAALLPYLAALAHTAGGTWIHAYDERLAQAGRRADRIELWATAATAVRSTTDERRAAAWRLHELGADEWAIRVIEPLVAAAGPLDPDVDLLMTLWGREPSREQRAWLASRLGQAGVSDQPGWIVRLVNAGGAREVLSVVPTLPAAATPTYVQAWINAHRAAGDRARLASALDVALSRGDLPEADVRAIGRIALADGLPAAATRAFLAVATTHPNDLEATRWLGTLAFSESRFADARRWFGSYRGAGGDEPEALFQLGELARRDGDAAAAREYFAMTVSRLEGAEVTVGTRVLLANALSRLGERERALSLFEAVLAMGDASDHIRADYASALLSWAEYERARTVLGIGSEPDHGPSSSTDGRGVTVASDAEAGGARRLGILRAQWLVIAGRYRAAERELDGLRARFPNDPDVLVARGAFDLDRGRAAEADSSFRAARQQAPDRDDISKLVDERRRSGTPRVTVQTVDRAVSDAWSDRSTRVTLDGQILPTIRATLSIEHLLLSAPRVLDFVGTTAGQPAGRGRFDASVTARLAPGLAATGMMFGTSRGMGVGAAVTRHDLHGAWTVALDRGRPFWDLPEGVADDGRRDRINIERQLRLGASMSGWVQAGWQWYRFASGTRLSSSAFGFSLSRLVWRGRPTLALQYGLDIERGLVPWVPAAVGDRTFVSPPLSSREVHVFGTTSRLRTAWWEIDAGAGYNVDRLGGRGPFLSVRLTPPPGARLGVELWADWRQSAIVTRQRARQAGAALRVGF